MTPLVAMKKRVAAKYRNCITLHTIVNAVVAPWHNSSSERKEAASSRFETKASSEFIFVPARRCALVTKQPVTSIGFPQQQSTGASEVLAIVGLRGTHIFWISWDLRGLFQLRLKKPHPMTTSNSESPLRVHALAMGSELVCMSRYTSFCV